MAWLAHHKLLDLGFASLGKNVFISTKASLYNCANIHIGHHVRIDVFCVLSAGEGRIRIGNYIHITVFCSIIGGGAITLNAFSNTSSIVSIYSSNDDYSGESQASPMVPSAFTKMSQAPVHLGWRVIVGSGSVILPAAILDEGAAAGVLTLIAKRCEAFGIYAGNPARRIKSWSCDLLDLERALMESLSQDQGSGGDH